MQGVRTKDWKAQLGNPSAQTHQRRTRTIAHQKQALRLWLSSRERFQEYSLLDIRIPQKTGIAQQIKKGDIKALCLAERKDISGLNRQAAKSNVDAGLKNRFASEIRREAASVNRKDHRLVWVWVSENLEKKQDLTRILPELKNKLGELKSTALYGSSKDSQQKR